jgi:hypothetical protein
VSQALMRNKLAPHQLELELTERVLIEDAANVQAVLAQLRALGVGISLDDFGTGYSSLSYLTQFHLNTLKIDRAFVMDIEHSERSNSLGRPSSRWGTASGCNWWRRAWRRRAGRHPKRWAATTCRATTSRGRPRRTSCCALPMSAPAPAPHTDFAI